MGCSTVLYVTRRKRAVQVIYGLCSAGYFLLLPDPVLLQKPLLSTVP